MTETNDDLELALYFITQLLRGEPDYWRWRPEQNTEILKGYGEKSPGRIFHTGWCSQFRELGDFLVEHGWAEIVDDSGGRDATYRIFASKMHSGVEHD